MDVAQQLGFEQQYLEFHKYLLQNLQSVPDTHPHYTPRPIDLSLRAGAVKAYVVFGCSVIEGALAAWGERIGVGAPGTLMKKPLGGLLAAWEVSGAPRSEVVPIWPQLQLLKQYRNFIHLGRSVMDPDAYWQNILAQEANLIAAVDEAISYLADNCSGL